MIAPTLFHKANAQRAEQWPHAMLATATHDTKRGEDARARLAVLSEVPEEWGRQVAGWSRLLRARLGDVEGRAPPDRTLQILPPRSIWQTRSLGSLERDADQGRAEASVLRPGFVCATLARLFEWPQKPRPVLAVAPRENGSKTAGFERTIKKTAPRTKGRVLGGAKRTAPCRAASPCSLTEWSYAACVGRRRSATSTRELGLLLRVI